MEANHSSAASAFDFDALTARCMNNLSLVQRVLAKFTGQVDIDLAALEQAVAAGNAPDVAKLAHRIKGMTASIEAKQMCADAGRCERTALAAAIDDLPALYEQLRADRNELFAAIAEAETSRLAGIAPASDLPTSAAPTRPAQADNAHQPGTTIRETPCEC